MAEVPFRPVRQLSEYKGKGASASRECHNELSANLVRKLQLFFIRKSNVNTVYLQISYKLK